MTAIGTLDKLAPAGSQFPHGRRLPTIDGIAGKPLVDPPDVSGTSDIGRQLPPNHAHKPTTSRQRSPRQFGCEDSDSKLHLLITSPYWQALKKRPL
jgi:hypothetical protein